VDASEVGVSQAILVVERTVHPRELRLGEAQEMEGADLRIEADVVIRHVDPVAHHRARRTDVAEALEDRQEVRLGNVLERVVREVEIDRPLRTQRARIADDSLDPENGQSARHVLRREGFFEKRQPIATDERILAELDEPSNALDRGDDLRPANVRRDIDRVDTRRSGHRCGDRRRRNQPVPSSRATKSFGTSFRPATSRKH
jgi:hypothetical protein